MVTEKIVKNAWYSHGAGVRLAEAEKLQLDEILPTLYGYHLVQLSDSGMSGFCSESLIRHRVLVHPQVTHQSLNSKVKAEFGELPFLSESVDVVVLLHTLENESNPHNILREAERILIPEGHLIITGINPISIWGGWYSYKKLLGRLPSSGHLISLRRLRDWLKLLNFQVKGGRLFYFKPPILNQAILNKIDFIERVGAKLWPFLGGGYTIVAAKKTIPLTPIKASWKTEKKLWVEGGLPKPTTNTIIKEEVNES